MIVPVIITGVVLFPFLLYIIFPSTDLIPAKITIHSLGEQGGNGQGSPVEAQPARPSDPENPERSLTPAMTEAAIDPEQAERDKLDLSELIDPFLDKEGAVFGGGLIAVALITLLAVNAAGLKPGVYTITVPAGAIMFLRDVSYDWRKRKESWALERRREEEEEREKEKENEEADSGRIEEKERVPSRASSSSSSFGLGNERDGRALSPPADRLPGGVAGDLYDLEEKRRTGFAGDGTPDVRIEEASDDEKSEKRSIDLSPAMSSSLEDTLLQSSGLEHLASSQPSTLASPPLRADGLSNANDDGPVSRSPHSSSHLSNSRPISVLTDSPRTSPSASPGPLPETKTAPPAISQTPYPPLRPSHLATPLSSSSSTSPPPPPRRRTTLASYLKPRLRWISITFPTVCAVFDHLPFLLVPFAFCMFILVQGLVTKGWVQVFANGWQKWTARTGPVGAVGGMGFISVVLCNVSSPFFIVPVVFGPVCLGFDVLSDFLFGFPSLSVYGDEHWGVHLVITSTSGLVPRQRAIGTNAISSCKSQSHQWSLSSLVFLPKADQRYSLPP